jgi:hypothetical protein
VHLEGRCVCALKKIGRFKTVRGETRFLPDPFCRIGTLVKMHGVL